MADGGDWGMTYFGDWSVWYPWQNYGNLLLCYAADFWREKQRKFLNFQNFLRFCHAPVIHCSSVWERLETYWRMCERVYVHVVIFSLQIFTQSGFFSFKNLTKLPKIHLCLPIMSFTIIQLTQYRQWSLDIRFLFQIFQRNCSRSFDGIHKHRPQVQDDIWIHRCQPRVRYFILSLTFML